MKINLKNPYHQAIIPIGLILLFHIGLKLAWLVGLMTPDNFQHYWISMFAVIMVFIMFNPILGLSAPNTNQYIGKSSTAYIFIVVIGALSTYLCTKESILQKPEMKAIYIVLTVGFLVFTSIINLMKVIVEWSKQNDEKHR